MHLGFLGDGLLRELVERFGEPFFDRGLISMNELEKRASSDPRSNTHQRDLGMRLLHDRKLKWAGRVLESSLEADPNDVSCRVGLACALDGMGKTQSALGQLEICLKKNPAYGPAMIAKAFCLEKLVDTKEAGVFYRLALGTSRNQKCIQDSAAKLAGTSEDSSSPDCRDSNESHPLELADHP